MNANIADANIAAVLSNDPNATGLMWAAERGIATASLNHKNFSTRLDFDRAMMHLIDSYSPDLVVLAGFMRILTPEFCNHYANRCMNIHPSLLPSFTGLHTHQRALDEGCRIAGCTIHFVTEILDNGAIISQGVVPILDGDTAEDVAERVLKVEHQLLPQAVADFVSGSLKIVGKRVLKSYEPSADAQLLA